MLKKLIEKIFHRQELKRLRDENRILNDVLKGDNVPLSMFEKKMILDCLISPHYVEKVSNPATKRFIREVYKILKAKIVESAR